MDIIKNEFLLKTPVLPLVTRHKKKKGNGQPTIPLTMSPPGFEPGTPRLKVVRFFAFPWLNENRNAVFMRFSGCFSLRYLIIYVWSATNNGRRLVFHLLRREVIDMVTYSDLIQFVLMIVSIIMLVVTVYNKPKK